MSFEKGAELIRKLRSSPDLDSKMSILTELETMLAKNIPLIVQLFDSLANSVYGLDQPFQIKAWGLDLLKRNLATDLPDEVAEVLPKAVTRIGQCLGFQSSPPIMAKALHCFTTIYPYLLRFIILHPTKCPELFSQMQNLSEVILKLDLNHDQQLKIQLVQFLIGSILALTPNQIGELVSPPDHPDLPKDLESIGMGYYRYLLSLIDVKDEDSTILASTIKCITALMFHRIRFADYILKKINQLYFSLPSHLNQNQQKELMKAIQYMSYHTLTAAKPELRNISKNYPIPGVKVEVSPKHQLTPNVKKDVQPEPPAAVTSVIELDRPVVKRQISPALEQQSQNKVFKGPDTNTQLDQTITPGPLDADKAATLIISTLQALTPTAINYAIREAQRVGLFDNNTNPNQMAIDHLVSGVIKQAPIGEPYRQIPESTISPKAEEIIRPEIVKEVIKALPEREPTPPVKPEPPVIIKPQPIIEVEKPKPTPIDWSFSQKQQILLGTLDRLLEHLTLSSTPASLTTLISFLASSLSYPLSVRQEISDKIILFVADNFETQLDLANGLLLSLYLEDPIHSKNLASPYQIALTTLLTKLTANLPPKSGPVHAFVEGLPYLPTLGLTWIDGLCSIESKQMLGLGLLKDVVETRPAHRLYGCKLMLKHASGVDKKLRTGAVVTCRNWYIDTTLNLSTQIEATALQNLSSLADLTPPSPDTSFTHDLATKSDLYLSLCSRTPSLLSHLFSLYPTLDESSIPALNQQLEPLIHTIGPSSIPLQQFVCQYPKGSENLALFCLEKLFSKVDLENKTDDHDLIIEAITNGFNSGQLEVAFLIKVISCFTKDQLIDQLRSILGQWDGKSESQEWGFVNSLYSLTPQPIMSAKEVLIQIHLNSFDEISIKVIKAVKLMLSDHVNFPSSVVVEALNELIDLNRIPLLVMRTMIELVKAHNANLLTVSSSIVPLLHKLVAKKVWNMPTQWEGFVLVCNLMGTPSHPVLLTLPYDPLNHIMTTCPNLKTALTQRVQSHLKLTHNIDPRLKPLLPLFQS